jgi:hypothetical protein
MYIIFTLGGLGVIVGFGYYITFFLDTLMTDATCPFTYNST